MLHAPDAPDAPDAPNTPNTPNTPHANLYFVDSPLALVYLIVSAIPIRGDMIVCKWESGYRSAGLYFYDGAKLIDQERGHSDYGTVPDCFKIITEFPPGYFDLPDRDIESMRGFKALDVRYDGECIISAARPEDLVSTYWHSDTGSTSRLSLGPTSDVRIKSIMKFDHYDDDEAVAILEFKGDTYLLHGRNFDPNTTLDYYVSSAINGANGMAHIPDEMLKYLRLFGISDNKILIMSV